MYVTVRILVLALLMLQVVMIVTSKICSFSYYATKTGECEMCRKCGIGEGLEKNCGHDQKGDMIPGKSRCKKCSKDQYSLNIGSITLCKPCRKCDGKRFKIMCSATADAVCEDCPIGFYEQNNECYRCSKCCDGSKEVERKRKCLNDGMAASHSCSQDSTCPPNPASTQKSPLKITMMLHQSTSSTQTATGLKSSLPKTTVSSTVSSTNQGSPLVYEIATSTQAPRISVTPSRNVKRSAHSTSKGYNVRSLKRLTTQASGTQLTTDRRVQKRTTANHPNSVDSTKGNRSHESVVKPFLLVVALVGVLIIIVLVLMCAKSRKTGRGQSKEVAIYSRQPQEVRISLSSAREEEEEEREVDSSEHFPPDSIAENKAVPYGHTGDHWYFDAEEGYFDTATKHQANKNSRGVKNCEGSRRSSGSRLSGSSSHELGAIDERYDGSSFTPVIRNTRPKFCKLCGRESSNEQLHYDETLGVLKECQKTTIKQSMDPCKDGIRSWKEVATYFRVPQETIDTWNAKIKSGDSPTESLLYYLNTQKITISLFLECLKKLERLDVHDSLLKHLRCKCNICR